MKAKELMIGNYIRNTNDNAIVQVATIERFGVTLKDRAYFLSFTAGEIKPISLTKEWLKKFGFDKNSREYQLIEKKTQFTLNLIGKYLHIKTDIGNGKWNDMLIDIPKYVHQLQNFWFAHTGKELTINA